MNCTGPLTKWCRLTVVELTNVGPDAMLVTSIPVCVLGHLSIRCCTSFRTREVTLGLNRDYMLFSTIALML